MRPMELDNLYITQEGLFKLAGIAAGELGFAHEPTDRCMDSLANGKEYSFNIARRATEEGYELFIQFDEVFMAKRGADNTIRKLRSGERTSLRSLHVNLGDVNEARGCSPYKIIPLSRLIVKKGLDRGWIHITEGVRVDLEKLRVVGTLRDFCKHLRVHYDVLGDYCDMAQAHEGGSIDVHEFRTYPKGLFCSNERAPWIGLDTCEDSASEVNNDGGRLRSIILAEDVDPVNHYAVHYMAERDIPLFIEQGLLEIVPDNVTEPAHAEIEPEQETKTMNSIKDSATAVVGTQKDAALLAAKIAVGTAANTLAVKAIQPKVGLVVRGYVDSPLGRLAIANAVSFAVAQFLGENKKAKVVSEAMVQAATIEALGELDIEGLITDMFDKISGSKVDTLMGQTTEKVVVD